MALTADIVAKYHAHNIKVIAYGIVAKDTTDFVKLKTMGVDAIQSDWVTNEQWNAAGN